MAGDRHRRRRHCLVDPARGRLHTLCADAARGLLGNRCGLPRPDALLLCLGAVVLLTRDIADPAALPAAVAAGGLVALLALLALTVAETDEAFANAYSGAVSLQNLLPGPRRRRSSRSRRGSGRSARSSSS